MYRRHGNKLSLVFLGCDLAVTIASWFGAYGLRYGLIPAPNGVPDFETVLAGLPPVVLLATISYRLCGLYEIHRLRQLPRELDVVFRAAGLLFLLSITMTFYRRDLYESRTALALFLVLDIVGLLGARRVIWHALKAMRRHGLNYGRALIVGGGRPGRAVAETIRRNDWTGLDVVGLVDNPQHGASQCPAPLGSLDQLTDVIRDHDIDHVFIALPLSRYGELPRIQRMLADLLVDVQLVPDVPNITGVRLQMEEIDQLAFVNLRGNPHRGWANLAKRSMDVGVGLAATIAFLPLMTFLAVIIKLTDGGPVLYVQSRTGLGGRTFSMYKFRTMRTNAESCSGPTWARRNDRRCTPIGRFMRRWSLDELPQLLNVLRGDMSLVGPRPERCVFVEKFCHHIPCYRQRHQVKAGMTGWAQINGWRGNTSIRHRLQCDLYYISNWSLWFDAKILLLTIIRGFRHRNAY